MRSGIFTVHPRWGPNSRELSFGSHNMIVLADKVVVVFKAHYSGHGVLRSRVCCHVYALECSSISLQRSSRYRLAATAKL